LVELEAHFESRHVNGCQEQGLDHDAEDGSDVADVKVAVRLVAHVEVEVDEQDHELHD